MKLIYIPLDERPCNYNFAQRIANGTAVELIAPPLELLGNKKAPAVKAGVFLWLYESVFFHSSEGFSLILS